MNDALVWLLSHAHRMVQREGVLSVYVTVNGSIFYGLSAAPDPGMRFTQAVQMARAESERWANGIKVMA